MTGFKHTKRLLLGTLGILAIKKVVKILKPRKRKNVFEILMAPMATKSSTPQQK